MTLRATGRPQMHIDVPWWGYMCEAVFSMGCLCRLTASERQFGRGPDFVNA